jgi:hypothetical protein
VLTAATVALAGLAPAAAAEDGVIAECDVTVRVLLDRDRAQTSDAAGSNVTLRVTNTCLDVATLTPERVAADLPAGLYLVPGSFRAGGDTFSVNVYAPAAGTYTVGDQTVEFTAPPPAVTAAAAAGFLDRLRAQLRALLARLLGLVAQR